MAGAATEAGVSHSVQTLPVLLDGGAEAIRELLSAHASGGVGLGHRDGSGRRSLPLLAKLPS